MFNRNQEKELTEQIGIRNIHRLEEVKKSVKKKMSSLEAKNEHLQEEIKTLRESRKSIYEKERQLKASERQQERTEAIARIKTQVNPVDFLSHSGWKVDKSKGNTNSFWVTMVNPTTKEKWICSNAHGRKGTFLMMPANDPSKADSLYGFLRQSGWEEKKILSLDTHWVSKEVSEYVSKKKRQEINPDMAEKLAEGRAEKFGELEKENFLTTKRGVSYEMLKEFGVQAKSSGALFKAQLNGKTCTTQEYLAEPAKSGATKYFQKGLPRGVVVFGEKNNPRNIVISESPVDNLSYEELARKNGKKLNALYIATCGNLTAPIKKEIANIIDSQKNIEKIIMAFDKDDAGEKMSNDLKAHLVKHKLKLLRHAPKLKDFNQVLKNIVFNITQNQYDVEEEKKKWKLKHSKGPVL